MNGAAAAIGSSSSPSSSSSSVAVGGGQQRQAEKRVQNGSSRPRPADAAGPPKNAASAAPPPPPSYPLIPEGWKPTRDLRSRLPRPLRRWTGYRDPDSKPPYACLPIPPFTWLAKLPLQYETWILSTVGSFVGIALIEVIISAAFPNDGTILIVASFGATAVLSFGTIESPLAQPRHLIGGQVLSCVLAVCVTKLFRLSPHYQLSDTIVPGELNHIVWINGALSMALSILLMQMTGTVHPPGGATAIIASVQPAAINMSWRLIYIVLISALIMTVWACIINNVGRRRYPTYWIHGTKTLVRTPRGELEKGTLDQAEMSLEEGRSPWTQNVQAEEIREIQPGNTDSVNPKGNLNGN